MQVKEIISNMKNIAVIGFSPDSSKVSNIVGKYLISRGFNVYPVYPKFDEIEGIKSYKNISDIKNKIDTIVMFRKGSFADELIDFAIKNNVKNLWLQLGIENENAKKRAIEHGINFVQNKCVMAESKSFYVSCG